MFQRYISVCVIMGIMAIWSMAGLASGVNSLDPAENSHAAALDTNVSATLSGTVTQGSVTSGTFCVHRGFAAPVPGLFSFPGSNTVMFNPDGDFLAGEAVESTLTGGVIAGGEPLTPCVWKFKVSVAPDTTGEFINSGQALGSYNSYGVALGDVDGDSDLDAFVANYVNPAATPVAFQPDTVWLNDGHGVFTDSGQRLGATGSSAVEMADLDGDGDLDAVVGCSSTGGGQPNRIYLNDGSGNFTDSGQSLGSGVTGGVAIGDVDGDGDLDIVEASFGGMSNIYLNNGSGTFAASANPIVSAYAFSCKLGDLDRDGDLDLFICGFYGGYSEVWLNDGTGVFTNTGQALGSTYNVDAEMGDLDGDGDLDVVASSMGLFTAMVPDIFINDGTGQLSAVSHTLNSHFGLGVCVDDMNGDGYLDILIGDMYPMSTRLYLNDGTGTFTDTGQMLDTPYLYGVASGDLDGDGDLDFFAAHNDISPNSVFIQDGPYPLPSTNLLGLIALAAAVSLLLMRGTRR